MKPQLTASRTELERWTDAGLTLPVWWRDDDAIDATPALERLLALAAEFGAPLHLAVIPAAATTELADRLEPVPSGFVLTHGWLHANRAPADQKKAEFGFHRPVNVMLEEIAAGRARLDGLFGAKALPIFTPPWNRIAPEVVDGLPSAGFAALSTYTPRRARFAVEGLLQVNTHLDPIAWKSGGGLLDPDLIDTQLARELEARRLGQADNQEPYGLITHHLVHDEAIWAFTKTLLLTFAASGVTRWTPPLQEIY